MPDSFLSPADWDQLEAYAAGTLTPADRAATEARLAAEPAFRQALAEHRALIAGLRAAGQAELRHRLARVETELAAVPPVQATAPASVPAPALRVSWRSHWGRMAAAAAVVLAAGLGTWALLRDSSAQALADRYGTPDPGLPVLMAGPVRRPLVNQAMNAHKTGDAAGALRAWEALPAGTVGADTVLYYRGIFQLRLHQNAAAAATLQRLRQVPTTAFRERAEYYFALALWAQGRNAEARWAFARLVAPPGHPFRADAQLALEQLD